MEAYNVQIAEKIAKGVYSLSPKRKGKSFVWNVISEILKEDGTILENYGYCRSCRKVLKYYNNQTSNLGRHKCCKSVRNPQDMRTVTVDDRQLAINACAEWIIEDCRPSSCVSGSGFAKLVKFFIKIGAYYGENVDIDDLLPDATTISRQVQEMAEETRKTISAEIKNIVKSGNASVAIDMWPDRYIKRNFLAVTLHYQKNFEALNIVLGLKSMDFQKSSGEDVLLKLQKLFKQFDIEELNGMKFVTDQETNIVEALKNKIRLSCSSHLLAKALEKSFEDTRELKETLQACKQLIKNFKRANLQHRLPTFVKDPCSKRWNSNYFLLKTITDNWGEINKVLLSLKEQETMRYLNLSTLAALVELCKQFEVIFKKMQVCNSPSLSFVLPSIYKIKSLCITTATDMPAISALKVNIVKNVDEIWVHNLSIWHMTAFFLFPPAVSKQQNDLKTIKEFCITQITKNNENECKSTAQQLVRNSSTGPDECTSSTNKEIDLIDIKETCLTEDTSFYYYNDNLNAQPLLNNDLVATTSKSVEQFSSDLVDIKDPCITQMANVYNCEATSTTQSVLCNDLPSTSNLNQNTPRSTDEYASTSKENEFFFSNWLDMSGNSASSFKETVKNEVEKYSKEAVKMTEDFDMIQWWKDNEKVYPNLSKFALQIHSMPASCSASGDAFSLVGNIINEKRCGLEPKSMNNLLFLNSYFKMSSAW